MSTQLIETSPTIGTTTPIRVSITGSRYYPATKDEWDALEAKEQLDQIDKTMAFVKEFVARLPEETTVISGGARGIDSYAVAAADERGLDTVVHLPEWEKYGKGAGFRRNKIIAEEADECLVFWDGASNGTRNFIKHAFNLRKPIYIIGPDGLPWAVYDKEFYDREGPNPRLDIPQG